MLIIDNLECLQCGGCVPLCPEDSLLLTWDSLSVDSNTCTNCKICVLFCPVSAMEVEDE